MSLEYGKTIPVTVRNAQVKDGIYRALFFEESLGPEGVNSVQFPMAWRGDTKWQDLKRRNFSRLLSTPGRKIDIEVNNHFVLVRVADETNEYFINNDDDDDWGSFGGGDSVSTISTTSTSSTTSISKQPTRCREPDCPLKEVVWENVPSVSSPSPKRAKIQSNESMSLGIVIKKGTSEYRKVLHVKDDSAYAAIEFLSRLIEAYPEDVTILQSMLKEFDGM